MASGAARSSRSRPAGHSGVLPAGAAAAGGVGVGAGVQLADKLKIFKTDKFDPDSYVQSKCQTMTEKEIRHLCSYLQDLKKASAEEMRTSVYANYAAFIRTSKEISELERELLSIRNLLNTESALIHGLSEGIQIDSLIMGPEDSAEENISTVEYQELSEIQKWHIDFPDKLDVLLAERRVDEALDALDEAERIAVDAEKQQTLATADIVALKEIISDNRQKLSDQLAEAACQSSTCGIELRAAASALKRLGDGPRAHSLLLSAHNQRLQSKIQTTRPSSTGHSVAYTASLAKQVFSVIANALSDSMEVFGNEPSYASELVTWATKQAMEFTLLVKRHALGSCAAAGGLRAAAECVQIALGYTSLLEARGLSLSAVLLKQFRPCVEQALDSNLRRIEESTSALAAADDWALIYPPTGIRTFARASAGNLALQPKLSSSAHRFNSMVQDFFEDVGPLLSLQLGGSTMDGLLKIFSTYVDLLVSALPGSMDDEANLEGLGNKIIRMAETEEQQLALLANASLLAEELLPRAAMKLSSVNQASMGSMRIRGPDKQNRAEQREWKRKLQHMVDKLRDSFCRQHALDLIFTEEGDTHLSAEMYINMDNNAEETEWVPSLIFQELYTKLNRMASIAAEMFVGRERFATLLMMRLTETVILWLSDDQSFWEEIEEGPRALGPLGLQQFYLDMQFVILFGQGRFLSRHVHTVILNIIDRAMAAFSATGLDPDSALPSDDWFIEIAQDNISRISGKARAGNSEREVHSPTASVSAQSVSSARSHGSS
ncbi:exocyst complex component EXO84B-like [Triticum urartu]|uniref:Exocyst component Exo84 C-terminal domain-containing protein n=1 Tax=Triticum urartu TaxID=4572 RepID=A0A8R7QH89_TRIUA|nr:exocyst complex component EXO84B-like [Triticum urartu]